MRTRGLPRPLLAVLLGQAKMHAYDLTLASSFPDSASGLPLLTRYFPDLMQQRYGEYFAKHPLKREIVATVAINHVINHAGITFLPTLSARTGVEYGAIVQAYIEADQAVGASRRRDDLLAAKGDAEAERRQLLAIEREVGEAVNARLERVGAPT
jgi:glutamate dehydrogenase